MVGERLLERAYANINLCPDGNVFIARWEKLRADGAVKGRQRRAGRRRQRGCLGGYWRGSRCRRWRSGTTRNRADIIVDEHVRCNDPVGLPADATKLQPG